MKERLLTRAARNGALLAAFLLSGCGTPHGQPQRTSEALPPNQVIDFAILYGDNCAGCHGDNGRGGAAVALADPARETRPALPVCSTLHRMSSGLRKRATPLASSVPSSP